MTEKTPEQGREALATLHDVMRISENDTARISAAKAILDRVAPKDDHEEQRNEAAERDAALAQARELLAEFAALKFTCLRLSREMAQTSPAPTDNAAG